MGEVARHVIILGNNTMAKTTLRVLHTSRYKAIISLFALAVNPAEKTMKKNLKNTLIA